MAVGRHHKCVFLFLIDLFVRLYLPSQKGSEVAAIEVSGLVLLLPFSPAWRETRWSDPLQPS